MPLFGNKTVFAIECELADYAPYGRVQLWLGGTPLLIEDDEDEPSELGVLTWKITETLWRWDLLERSELPSMPKQEALNAVLNAWRSGSLDSLACCKWVFPTDQFDQIESAFCPTDDGVRVIWRRADGEPSTDVHEAWVPRLDYVAVVAEFCEWIENVTGASIISATWKKRKMSVTDKVTRARAEKSSDAKPVFEPSFALKGKSLGGRTPDQVVEEIMRLLGLSRLDWIYENENEVAEVVSKLCNRLRPSARMSVVRNVIAGIRDAFDGENHRCRVILGQACSRRNQDQNWTEWDVDLLTLQHDDDSFLSWQPGEHGPGYCDCSGLKKGLDKELHSSSNFERGVCPFCFREVKFD